MGIEKAPIGRALPHTVTGTSAFIRRCANMITAGSYAVTDDGTVLRMSARANRNLGEALKRRRGHLKKWMELK
jgi:hypothetical protein